MKNDIQLSAIQIEEIRSLAISTRKEWVGEDVPIGSDIPMLIEKKGIYLCEYPFKAAQNSHTDATITRFETGDEPLVFIGLNTSLYYDEQIFALAHELYHFLTHTGKAYDNAADAEDKITERMADRYAAELLLPESPLKSNIILEFRQENLNRISRLRILRFIAALQGTWWLPYRSILLRLQEEGYLDDEMFSELFREDARDPESSYAKIFRTLDPDIYKLLNCRTEKKGVTQNVLEAVIRNYEDDAISDDEFIQDLQVFGIAPSDLGFSMDAFSKGGSADED